uniref:Ground-like domain-containing protein n=1 Tax=Rhabditophanes sp. KR3021 TaxID=114890 RepID=A0AC35U9C8_9BILA
MLRFKAILVIGAAIALLLPVYSQDNVNLLRNIFNPRRNDKAFSALGRPFFVPAKQSPPPAACMLAATGKGCCNATLGKLMHETYETMKKAPTFSGCNLHKAAFTIQKAAQSNFKMPFETIASSGDFVTKSHQTTGVSCKVEIDGKTFLAYGIN